MSLRQHRLWFRHKAASRPDYLQCTTPAAAAMREPEEEKTDQMWMLSSTMQSTEHSGPEHATILLFEYEKPFLLHTGPNRFYFGRDIKACELQHQQLFWH